MRVSSSRELAIIVVSKLNCSPSSASSYSIAEMMPIMPCSGVLSS
jgi:hypothetical protein